MDFPALKYAVDSTFNLPEDMDERLFFCIISSKLTSHVSLGIKFMYHFHRVTDRVKVT
jgi:hypothetical protein